MLVAFKDSEAVEPRLVRRFNMMHVQNASLAGGVAMGAASNLFLTPGGPPS